MTSQSQCFLMNVNRAITPDINTENNEAKPQITKDKIISYEEKSVGSTAFFKCEACPYMALAEDDIKFHLFTVHPDLAKTNGLADNIQILCPGCTSVFDTEETLRTHLRNHHKMGIKDVKKMIKSLLQIALKNAKLKREDNIDPAIPVRQDLNDVKIPQIIEIVPDDSKINESLPKGVAFISVEELQKMSAPNFEKVDPTEIIQEASINILYSNELSNKYVPDGTASNVLQSVTPDLISSIQSHTSQSIDKMTINIPQDDSTPQLPNKGRPLGSRNSTYKKNSTSNSTEMDESCSIKGCYIRLKAKDKMLYHRNCHQSGALQCPECNQIFPCIEPLHMHLWKMHSIDMELPTCDICGYKTYKRHRLNNIHMKIHGDVKDYQCTVCFKSFKTSNQLGKHRMIHKEGIICPACPQEFTTERRLKIHIASVHNKLKPFKCSYCSYTAARKDEVKLHMRSHTGDKPYSCDQCSYRAADHNAMRRHKKLHSKESLYKCKYCPYTTIQSTVFASHMISKHPDVTANGVFRCPYCPYRSISKKKYVGHLSNNHADNEGVQLLIEMQRNTKPSWTIPDNKADEQTAGDSNKTVTNVLIDVDDCDSQQEVKNNYCNIPIEDQVSVTKTDDNPGLISISDSDISMIDRHQYTQVPLQNSTYDDSQSKLQFLSTTVSIDQGLLQSTSVNCITSNHSPRTSICNIMNNFPIRLPPVMSGNNFTLKPVDKIHPPMTKVTGPIITPTQILPVPSSSHSPINTVNETDGMPRKKAKISVKSNLILKGPDQVNMFHSQQKMAFKQLEDSERFGLNGPVTFNNLISTQFMQLPEPTLTESSGDIIPYPQETMLDDTATAEGAEMTGDAQLFTYQQINNILPQQQKIQNSDPSYIKLEATIKQNTQSPSLERMCNANILLTTQGITREYKASPPPEDIHIHKSLSEIKNEVKSDSFYNIPITNTASNAPIMDQYLMDNMIGEQYQAHMDLSAVVLPEINDQQNDVIEIDDNSDDNKLLPRFDINFPLDSLYSMHNDYYFLDNEPATSNLQNDSITDMNRVTEVPIIDQNKDNLTIVNTNENPNDYVNFIQGRKDPMMNTSVRVTMNKINVKNIELMKN